MIKRFAAALLVALPLASAATAQDQPSLGVGDPVPAIDIEHFFKGKEVDAFSKERIYVLEFWATW
jgi:hypothetical protein